MSVDTPIPIFDLHCDLLSYLHAVNNDPFDTEAIGCAIPHLQQGNVGWQVLAIYSDQNVGSSDRALGQAEKYNQLLQLPTQDVVRFQTTQTSNHQINAIVAIENATGFAEADDSLERCFQKLDNLQSLCGKILYIGITHHYENRFGGGNYSNNVGLKPDGESLLHYLHNKNIALDFAHASDQLVIDCLNYIDKHQLSIPVMASHSNFRSVCNHVRNLPDELAQEIIRRKGIIGINFLRDYVDKEDPSKLIEHIHYGLQLGGAHHLAFGADFFYTLNMPDQSRQPFFFKEHENASVYPSVLTALRQSGLAEHQLEAIAFQNVHTFMERFIL